ncbi:MAG: hypothetical protein R2867_13385 [Caldilineaceae bacterium]
MRHLSGDTASDGDASTGEAAMAGGPCSEVEVGESAGMPDFRAARCAIAVENAYQPFNFIDRFGRRGRL